MPKTSGSSVPSEYPPANFYFRVNVLSSGGRPPRNSVDASFQEVSGIAAELEVEPYREGGRNGYAHRLPVRTKYQNLVLKRGLVSQTSQLFEWCLNTLGTGTMPMLPIVPKDISVDLLGTEGADKDNVLKSWTFNRAWPVKWEISNLNAMGNEVVVETLEFTYDCFTVK